MYSFTIHFYILASISAVGQTIKYRYYSADTTRNVFEISAGTSGNVYRRDEKIDDSYSLRLSASNLLN